MPETQRHSKKVRRGDRFFFSRAKISLKKKSVHFAGSLEPLIREGRPQNGNSGRSGARFRVLGRFWGPGRETGEVVRSGLRGSRRPDLAPETSSDRADETSRPVGLARPDLGSCVPGGQILGPGRDLATGRRNLRGIVSGGLFLRTGMQKIFCMICSILRQLRSLLLKSSAHQV